MEITPEIIGRHRFNAENAEVLVSFSCVYVWCVYVCVYMCDASVRACGSPHMTLGVFLGCFSPIFVRTGSLHQRACSGDSPAPPQEAPNSAPLATLQALLTADFQLQTHNAVALTATFTDAGVEPCLTTGPQHAAFRVHSRGGGSQE